MNKKVEIEEKDEIYPRIILGLDISTVCIGACVVKDTGEDKPEIIKLTHVSPKIKGKIKGIEALFLRKDIFEKEFIPSLSGLGITDVVIEEPLLSSNNINTVATLLRFNGMISECIYRILGIVPNFISSYDARMYSFPELVCIRKYNKKSVEYPVTTIKKALKDSKIVLFGAYPFDIDKKSIMMNMVNQEFQDIPWVKDKFGELKKENYDACDSLICALAYININHHGLDKPIVKEYNIIEENNTYKINYTTKIWNKEYNKVIYLEK